MTFCCRPNNPSGALGDLPAQRPLIVDEAYYEYAGETSAPLIDEGVVVIRTFSKAFGLAGGRAGYALADAETAAELNRRQSPAPISTLSAALAVAALADPPDVSAQVEEQRLARGLRALGLAPLPSRTNFVFVPVDAPEELGAALLRSGLVVRVFPDGIRASVRDPEDDDLLLEGIARARPARSRRRPWPPSARHLRATAETRVRVRLALDGASRVRVATGAGLYDHLLEQLAFHAGFDLALEAAGDLETGEHHTVEDAAIALGEALDQAFGDRRGIARFGDAVLPMDDALAPARSTSPRCGWRLTRAWPTTCSAPWPRRLGSACTSTRPAATRTTSPRPRSRRPAGASLCGEARGRRDSVNEGSLVRVAVCEYEAGNVGSVVLACERLGAEVRATSDPEMVERADLAVLPGVGSARSAIEASRPAGSTTRSTTGSSRGDRRSGSAWGSSWLSSRRTRTAASVDWAFCRDAPCGCEKGAFPASDGRVSIRAARCSTSHTRTPRRHPPQPRAPRASSPSPSAELRRRPVPSGEERPSGRPLPGPMPLPRLIPCLDVAGGRVVKGVRFQGLRDVGDPSSWARPTRVGADELVFLDVSATVQGRDTLVGLVRRVAERLAIPFTVGGGVRTVGDAEALLEAGADKVSVNSAALASPELLTALAERLGSQAVVLAIDAAGGKGAVARRRACHGRTTAEWAREGEERGAGEILLTSIDTDGTPERLRPRIDRGSGARRVRARDRVGRRRLGGPRRGRARGRAGRAPGLDPAREPRPSGRVERRAPRPGGATPRCRLSSGQQSSRMPNPAACSCSPGWTTRRFA